MNKTKFLGIVLGLTSLAGVAHAAEPVAMDERAVASKYAISYSTVSVSSSSVRTIAGGTGFRQITIDNVHGTSTISYRLDGASTGMPTTGLVIRANTKETVETQSAISLRLFPGTTAYDVRVQIKQKY